MHCAKHAHIIHLREELLAAGAMWATFLGRFVSTFSISGASFSLAKEESTYEENDEESISVPALSGGKEIFRG